MKKFFLFAAAVVAAMTINAHEAEQTIIVVEDYCNYINFQAVTSSTTVPTSEENTWYKFANGAVCKGFKKSDNTEAANSWNVKETNTANTFPMPNETKIDSVKWGTVYRAASGSSIELGAFELKEEGAVEVFFQPNGNSERGVTITFGDIIAECKQAVENKNVAFKAVLTLSAGSYDAGDIVIKAVGNTVNIAGVNIVGLAATQAIENTAAAVKAEKFFRNGQLIIRKNGVEYNALGAQL